MGKIKKYSALHVLLLDDIYMCRNVWYYSNWCLCARTLVEHLENKEMKSSKKKGKRESFPTIKLIYQLTCSDTSSTYTPLDYNLLN